MLVGIQQAAAGGRIGWLPTKQLGLGKLRWVLS